jgi:tetratricopeptide (TPR) repeat protein
MFLYIPLGIFAVSIIGIVWIVSRKFVYLKKLEPQALEATSGDIGFWAELFPELADFFKKLKFRQYGVNLLSETEKSLRKMRLFAMKADSFTNRLINRVRKSTKKQEAIIIKKAVEEEESKPAEIDPFDLAGSTKEELKQKEQYLIIEIAKNPKDAPLYKELGSLYMRTGELEDAKQSFEKALELEPDDNTKRKLGRVLGKLEEKK